MSQEGRAGTVHPSHCTDRELRPWTCPRPSRELMTPAFPHPCWSKGHGSLRGGQAQGVGEARVGRASKGVQSTPEKPPPPNLSRLRLPRLTPAAALQDRELGSAGAPDGETPFAGNSSPPPRQKRPSRSVLEASRGKNSPFHPPGRASQKSWENSPTSWSAAAGPAGGRGRWALGLDVTTGKAPSWGQQGGALPILVWMSGGWRCRWHALS